MGGSLLILVRDSRILLGHFRPNINTFLESSAQAQSMGTIVGLFDLSGGLVIEMHGMSPSRPRGCVQAYYQQLIPDLQFTHCIMHRLHD